MADSQDIKDAHPYLQEKWPDIKALYKKITERALFLTCTYRSPETQQILYQQGRSTPGDIVTQIDGVTRKSNHNYSPSRAIDICVNGAPAGVLKIAPLWDEDFYLPLIGICDRYGLISGGSWEHFKDWPHIELPKGMV